MKISEMTNDQAAEALIRIADPMSRICDNDDIVKLFRQVPAMQKLPRVQAFGKLLPKVVIFCLKDHRADLYEIIAALQMENVEKVGKMNFKETVEAVKDSYDSTIKDFFT